MSLETLFGKLQEHEMELMRLHQHEENDKNNKGTALRASSSCIQFVSSTLSGLLED